MLSSTQPRPLAPLLALAALVVAGCGGSEMESPDAESGQAAPPAAITRAEIDVLRTAFTDAMIAGNVDAALALYAEDAVFHQADGTKMRGPAEITEYLVAATEAPMTDITITPGAMGAGPFLAWETGTFSGTMTPEGGEPTPVSNSYLVVVERQPDGSLLIVQDAEWPAPPEDRDGGM